MDDFDLDEKSKKLGVIVLAVILFVLIGAGLYVATIGNSADFQQKCEAQCQFQDKNGLVAPFGTVGKSIEGGRDLADPTYQCTCTKKSAN